MAWESCEGQLLALMHELDAYSRALRATTIARALLPLDVDIVGAGWDHLRHEPGRARFSAMPASGFDALCAETRILVTATPNINSGAAEGVLRGFAARCCVTADDNDFARDRLRRLPSYRGLEWQEPDLPDRLAALCEDLALAEEELDPAQAHVEARHDPASCLAGMLHLAQRARAQAASWDGVLDAA